MNEIYVRSKSVVSRQVGDDTLVVPVRGGVGDLASIFSLNETASEIWQMLAKPSAFEDLISHIVWVFDVSRNTAEADLLPFLGEMEAAGLVEMNHFDHAVGDQLGEPLLHSEVA